MFPTVKMHITGLLSCQVDNEMLCLWGFS